MSRYEAIPRTPSAHDFPLLLKQLLISPIARASKNEIVYRDQLRYGYPTLIERIARLANVLTGLGAQAGQTVAVMDWDSHRYLESYFAVPMLGCVLQTVNIRLSPEQILYTLNHAGADILIVNCDFLPVLETLRGQLDTVKTFILIDEANARPKTGFAFAGEYEALMAQAAPRREFPDFDENTRATTFYTSGTTGNPKGVYYSHRQLVLHTMGVCANHGSAPANGRLHGEDVYLPITPLFHAHGWGMPYVATLLGLKQVYSGRYTPEMLCQLLKTEKATFSHCVPTILHMILSCPASKDIDLRGWKVLIGGSALSKGLARQALERGIDVFTGYGMSETCPMQVANLLSSAEAAEPDLDKQAALRARTGRPALLCDVRALDEDSQPLPRDGQSVGEISFRSPWLTQGYFKNPQASEDVWHGGWLHSGDIGCFGADGVLQISDRVKDVIKTGGEWVSSLEIEDLLSQHPAVGEVAVIGIPDAKWGERPLALVVPKSGQDRIDAAGLRAHLAKFADKGVISKYGVPDRILFVEALDKTSVGKLDKKVLRAKYQHLAQSDAA